MFEENLVQTDKPTSNKHTFNISVHVSWIDVLFSKKEKRARIVRLLTSSSM